MTAFCRPFAAAALLQQFEHWLGLHVFRSVQQNVTPAHCAARRKCPSQFGSCGQEFAPVFVLFFLRPLRTEERWNSELQVHCQGEQSFALCTCCSFQLSSRK